jgi:electron transport complex protein RnfG
MDKKRLQKLKTMPAIHALLLGGFALLATVILALGDRLTRPSIALRRSEDLQRSLAQVIPPDLHDNDLLADTVNLPEREGGKKRRVYLARRGGVIEAVAFRVEGPGYGGLITLVMGVDRDGSILGVRVISHAETPGLGDAIEAEKSRWITGFDGKTLADPPPGDWKVKKDGGFFDQFSGATITPRAVVRAVKGGLVFFRRHRDRLLKDRP